jgi:1-acyl-sn-glycerol-3-phosphate acyltransferase
MPKGRNWPVPGRPPVRVVFGQPIHPQPNETPVQLMDRVVAFIAGA